jgi:hypothetical protein
MQSTTVHGLLLTAAKEERQGHGSLSLNAGYSSAQVVVVVDCSQGGEAGAWIIVIECRL